MVGISVRDNFLMNRKSLALVVSTLLLYCAVTRISSLIVYCKSELENVATQSNVPVSS